jgi:hypothetical protein
MNSPRFFKTRLVSAAVFQKYASCSIAEQLMTQSNVSSGNPKALPLPTINSAVLDKAAGFPNWRLSATFLASLRSGIDNRVLELAPTSKTEQEREG